MLCHASVPPFGSTRRYHVDACRSSAVRRSEVVLLVAVLHDWTRTPTSQIWPGVVATVWYTPPRQVLYGQFHPWPDAPLRTRPPVPVTKYTGRSIFRPSGLPDCVPSKREA